MLTFFFFFFKFVFQTSNLNFACLLIDILDILIDDSPKVGITTSLMNAGRGLLGIEKPPNTGGKSRCKDENCDHREYRWYAKQIIDGQCPSCRV